MLEAFRRFLTSRPAAGASGADADHRVAVAVCALLLEAAHADDEFTPIERETVRGLVREQFGLDAGAADELLGHAEARRGGCTGLYDFTRPIAEGYDRDGKLSVLELLWRVIYSDGRLEAHEDALIHKLAYLLGLDHADLIALKLRVKGA